MAWYSSVPHVEVANGIGITTPSEAYDFARLNSPFLKRDHGKGMDLRKIHIAAR
jgi:hypothetical protein